jgi:membrane protein involved in colicin uptake
MDEFKRVLQDAFKGFESEITKKMAELESRLKALEEAKKMAEEAEEAKKKTEGEMKKNAEEAKDKEDEEDRYEEAEEAEVEASLQKSSTLVGKPKKGFYGWNDVIAELDLAMRKQVPTFKG